MRKLIYAINLSIDGCCDHTRLSGGEDIHEYFTALMQEMGLLVYGRTTYELMVPFWPDMAQNKSGQTKAMNDFAQTFNAVPKLVFSRSAYTTEDKNTRVAQADLREEILRLKQEPGKDMLAGGVNLPSQLIASGLVDEYRIVVQPVIVGAGRRLDHIDLRENLSLRLADSTTLKSGRIALHYVKD